MPYRLAKLDQELRSANIPIDGVRAIGAAIGEPPDRIAEDVAIDYKASATLADKTSAEAIKAAHNTTTPYLDYYTAFRNQARVIARAFYAFHEGFRAATVPPTLAQYRTTLGSALAIINTLPTSFITELSQERAGLALVDPNVTPLGSWTLAQCQGWHTLLSGWFGRMMAAVTIAMYQDLD